MHLIVCCNVFFVLCLELASMPARTSPLLGHVGAFWGSQPVALRVLCGPEQNRRVPQDFAVSFFGAVVAAEGLGAKAVQSVQSLGPGEGSLQQLVEKRPQDFVTVQAGTAGGLDDAEEQSSGYLRKPTTAEKESNIPAFPYIIGSILLHEQKKQQFGAESILQRVLDGNGSWPRMYRRVCSSGLPARGGLRGLEQTQPVVKRVCGETADEDAYSIILDGGKLVPQVLIPCLSQASQLHAHAFVWIAIEKIAS